MSTGRKAAAWGVGFCWFVALFLAVMPVKSDYGTPRPDNAMHCPSAAVGALTSGEETAQALLCGHGSRVRIAHLLQWLVVTGAASTAFVATRPRVVPAPGE